MPSLSLFQAIDLKGLDKVKLMDRMDTKFIFRLDQLPIVLEGLKDDYFILEVAGNRISQYKSLYYDTLEKGLYLRHHNNRKKRFKLRYRKYVESDTCFFEVKLKNQKGRTNKKRIRTSDISMTLGDVESALLRQNISTNPSVFTPSIWINFSRITIADKNFTERATLDLGLNYEWNNRNKSFDNIVIAEVKQPTVDRSSKLVTTLKQNSILPKRISKYCIGIISCHDNIKYNRFKRKFLAINKITNGYN